MKRLFSLFVLLVACTYSFATVRTLCNASYCNGTYSTFDDVQTASANGDTIYVQGSTIDYGSITITKSLTIIGTGHNPNKQNPVVSTFVNVLILTDNVQLIGLRITHLGASNASNGIVKKCRISGTAGWPVYLSTTSGWLIEGNIIESTDNSICIFFGGNSSPNTIVQHNIVLGGSYKVAGLANAFTERTYFINNVFLGPLGGNIHTFNEVDNCSIDNNIFYLSIPDGGNPFLYLESCTMNNNISYGSADDTFYQPGLNNLSGVDPQFVNYPGPPAMYTYSLDLSLEPTSPGHNTGTDATDRGVFGGTGNKFTVTGEPSIAEITAFTITSPTTIAPGGSLTISVTSKVVH
jgi:hypothetical protein